MQSSQVGPRCQLPESQNSKIKSQEIDQVQHLIFFSTQDFSQDFCKYQKSIRRKVLFNNLTKPTKPEGETLKRKRLWKESGDDSNFGRSLAWNLGKFTSLGDSFRLEWFQRVSPNGAPNVDKCKTIHIQDSTEFCSKTIVCLSLYLFTTCCHSHYVVSFRISPRAFPRSRQSWE